MKFGLKVLRIEVLTGRPKMPVCSVTFLISCSTIKPKELEYCYYNMETEVVLPLSALVLMLQGTTISLLPTPICGGQ